MSLSHTAIFVFAVLVSATLSKDAAPSQPPGLHDDFATLEHHLTHTLTHHYLWPWRQLFEAAAALDLEETLEEPQIESDAEKFQVNLSVKRFKPDELKVKVKNRHMIVEGKQRPSGSGHKFAINHFVQRFMLPPGSKQEEVEAVLKANGVLSISVPKHELPPPPPEREVPIVVLKPAETTTEKVEISTEKKETTSKVEEAQETTILPLEQLAVTENTTHVGKIRKKELKVDNKTAKDNEVSKGLYDNNIEDAIETNE